MFSIIFRAKMRLLFQMKDKDPVLSALRSFQTNKGYYLPHKIRPRATVSRGDTSFLK